MYKEFGTAPRIRTETIFVLNEATPADWSSAANMVADEGFEPVTVLILSQTPPANWANRPYKVVRESGVEPPESQPSQDCRFSICVLTH